MIGWKRRLKYRRLIKNLINRPREPAISDFSSTPYPHHGSPTTPTQPLPPPPVELIDAVAGWGQWRNQQPPPLEVWRHRCPEMRVARCVSGNLCNAPPRNSLSSRRRQPVFRTLNPRLMPRFLFSFFFSPLFSIRQLVALTSLHRAGHQLHIRKMERAVAR